MKKKYKEHLHTQYSELQEVINKYIGGDVKASDVKHQSALLGIYKERDETIMLRLRMTGGEVTTQNFRDIADIMEDVGIDHGHLSTRQNIQLHGLALEKVEETLKKFYAVHIHTRGGGGNTFRNVITSSKSGVSATEVFDTMPYIKSVWDYVYCYQKAFEFGRKLKVGFTSEPFDDTDAGIQDLGFIPKVVDGKRGFKVYGGGGMGRGGATGIVLFEFLPAEQIIQATVAMIDLFYDHGDRTNRSKARLRFILEKLGEEKFRELYIEYFNNTEIPKNLKDVEDEDYDAYVAGLKKFDQVELDTAEYKGWVKRAVTDTKFGDDVVSVRLFVNHGNFKADDFRRFATLVDSLGTPFVRITLEQDALLPIVHRSALPYLYEALQNKLPNQATTDESFIHHIVSCIGARLCPIGILRSPEAAERIANSLDQLFVDKANLRDELYQQLIGSINVSGCPSSCGRNQSSALGFNGLKKKIDGELTELYQVHVGANISEDGYNLAKTDGRWLVRSDEIGVFVKNVVSSFIDEYEAGRFNTFREYMISCRDEFKVEAYI